jgi:hypothetical protein
MQSKKKCSQCEKVLDVAEFNKDRGKSDGLCRMCKQCLRQYRNAMMTRKSNGNSYADNVMRDLDGGEM